MCNEYVEAIVNPANEQLEHIEEVSSEILNKGGEVIKDESKRYIREHGMLSTGCAMVTSAGNLPCKAVIHAVGPRFNEASIDHTFEEILMQSTITAILEQVVKNDYKSVSIPAISSEVLKFPLTRFAVTCTKAIKEFVNSHKQEMKNRKIILCNFDDDTTNRLLEVVPKKLEQDEESKNEKQSKDKDKKSSNNPKDRDDKESEESEDEIKRCKKWSKKIKDRSHQMKGKYLKLWKKCFDKKRKYSKIVYITFLT